MEFTKSELQKMAATALFLKERLAGGSFCFIESNEEIANKRYAQWIKKAGGNGGKMAFDKRLSLDCINPDDVKRVVSDIDWKEQAALPPWAEQINEIINLLPSNIEALQSKLHFNKEKENIRNNDMVDAVLPFICYAENQLISKLHGKIDIYNDNAFSNMSRTLVQVISPLCFKTFLGEFNESASVQNPVAFLFGPEMSPSERASAWRNYTDNALAGYWKDILLKYPVLARLIITVINDWIHFFCQLTDHLNEDMPKLEAVFGGGRPLGSVARLEGDLSDRHNKGRSVLILEFTSGKKIVYKPRCLDIDEAWQYFNAWLSAEGFAYAAQTPGIINSEDHGWVEYVNYEPLKSKYEAEEFYTRAGALLALIYALGGNDFHAENLIAWGKYPVLIDLETLLLHKVKPFKMDSEGISASQMANDILSESALRTGFMPLWRNNRKGQAVDWGALTGDNNGSKNIPLYNGEKLNVSHYEKLLLQGFSICYDFLLQNQERLTAEDSVLKAFSNCKMRFIIRSTQVYADMLNHVTGPGFLKNGLDYSFEVERLGCAYLLSAPDHILPELWNIFISERDAIERRDIPIFYGKAEALGLIDHEKTLYDGYFMVSALERSKAIINSLSPKDKSFQEDLIKSSLSIYEGRSHDHKSKAAFYKYQLIETKVLDHNELLEEAESIYDQLIAKRIMSLDGDFTWIVRQFDMETQKINLGQINLPLYDGRIGLALFMAALYHLTGREAVKETALKTIALFRKGLYDTYNPLPLHRFPVGIGSGLGGVIKALLLMHSYLGEEYLLKDAVYIASKISEEQIGRDTSYDVIGGTSGLTLALTSLYEAVQHEDIYESARLCGKHLLNNRTKAKSGHRVWTSGIEKEPLSGLGHGAAGHAAALMKLHGITGDHIYYDAAVEAMEYEAGLFYPERNNWVDLRKNPDLMPGEKAFMAGWCSGAPGIGLARLHSLGAKTDYPVEKDISRALAFTLSHTMNTSDHICCGNSGRVDFLIEAALVLNRADLLDEAKKRISWMIQRKESIGSYVFNGEEKGAIFNPSLFQGITGIGYEFLRCLAPDKIRTILI